MNPVITLESAWSVSGTEVLHKSATWALMDCLCVHSLLSGISLAQPDPFLSFVWGREEKGLVNIVVMLS